MGQKFSKKSTQEEVIGNESPNNEDQGMKSLKFDKKDEIEKINSCCICYDEFPINNVSSMSLSPHALLLSSPHCNHKFCSSCYQHWIQSELEMFSSGEIRCPNHTQCGSKLDITLYSSTLPPEIYHTLMTRQYEHFLLINSQQYHRCSNSQCSFVYEYSPNPDSCKNFYQVGDKVFFFGQHSYYMSPGIVIDTRSGKYEVKDCTPTAESGDMNTPYLVSNMNMIHRDDILTYGAEVEYLVGEKSFFNRPKGYKISRIRRSADGKILYDILPRISGDPSLNEVSFEQLIISKSKFLENKHTYHCAQCNQTGCIKCAQKHSRDVTCEDHAAQLLRDTENILLMTKYRENYLQQLQTEQNFSSTPDMNATVDLLNQLEIRICHQCKNGVSKSSGCNKLMCRCGYKFCYHCGVENAACLCTPSSHAYINNVDGAIVD